MHIRKAPTIAVLAIGLASVLSIACVLTVLVFNPPDVKDESVRIKRTQSTCSEDAVNQLKDVINSTQICTKKQLFVSFENQISCNKEMTKERTANAPVVKYDSSIAGEALDTAATYTLLMVDPDAPGCSEEKEKLKVFLHWAVTGIKKCNLENGNFSGTKVLKEYQGPSPPSDTKEGMFHRYQLILVKLTTEIEALPDNNGGLFSLAEFFKDRLCEIAGMFQFKVPVKPA